VFAGQVFFAPPDEVDVRFFREQARRFGFDEEAYLSAFREIPVFPEEKFRAALSFLSSFAKLIADIGHARLRELEAMETLREREATLNEAQEVAKMGSFSWNMVSDTLELSDQMFAIAGFKRNRFSGKFEDMIETFVHPEDRDSLRREIRKMVDEKRTWPTEFRLVRPDGEIRWLRSGCRFTYDDRGTPTKCIGVHHDVTEQRVAEETLRRSEKKYRQLVENVNDVLYSVDHTGVVTFVSPSVESVLGLEPSKIVGRNFQNLVHPDDLDRVRRAFGDILQGRLYESEYRLRAKSGEYRWVRTSSRPVKNGDRVVGLHGVLSDVTDRKQAEAEKAILEKQLQQSRRLDALSTLAGGLAHDFNNSLSAVHTNLELLKMEFSDHREVMEHIHPVLDSADRMGRLTNQLTAYAQGGKYRARNISISRYVEDVLPGIVHPDVALEVRKDLRQDIPNIHADVTQMHMVLSSIVRNAQEAIEASGCIKIYTGLKEVDHLFVKHRARLEPGRYVYLRIEDDGRGMDEAVRSRIFEPFFSTKEQGRGLGMAATYGIVKNHNGWIEVDSEPGRGTRVEVYFPVSQVQEDAVREPRANLSYGGGTVLVIEDEKPVMDAMKRALELLGYHVVAAASGKEGVEHVQAAQGEIDLAILDVGLPDMPGDSVYKALIEKQAGLKVLICSGYAPSDMTQDILDKGASGFVQKPFSLAEFSAKVKEMFETEERRE
jgi:PAS domain S-box-containing protein